MKFAALLPLMLLAACETPQRPYAPVDDVRYSAIGTQPFWMVTIGDDRIALRIGGAEGADGQVEGVWPRTLPQTVDGTRTWTSENGTSAISVEARPGPCTGAGGRMYEDAVRVRLNGQELNGCGGRLLRGESR